MTIDSMPWSGRALAVAGLATAIALGTAVVAIPSALGAPATASPGAGCLANTSHATVHLKIEDRPTPTVRGIAFADFDGASCNGATIHVDLRGNPSGNPNRPARELLSTLDSAKSACTGTQLPDALTIHGGAIDLAACDTAAPDAVAGSPADLHDLTLLVVKIGGDQTTVSVGSGGSPDCPSGAANSCVLGEKVTRPSGSARTGSSALPFTGTWAALGLTLGAFVLLLGILLVALNRRRRHALRP